MSDRKLTPKEKRVLYFLIKYPTESDRYVSTKSGIKLSTVTAIKNRLADMGYFFKRRIPYYHNVGFELFNFSTWDMIKEQEINQITELDSLIPLRYVMGKSGTQLFMMNFSRRYTDTWTAVNSINRRIVEQNNKARLKETELFDPYPLGESVILSFFDYHPLASKVFELDIEDKLVPMRAESDYEFSKIEKKVYNALIESPDLPDTGISEVYGMTRQLVARLKKKFEAEKLLKTIREPSLKKLGYDITEISSLEFKYDVNEETLVKILRKELRDVRPYLSILSGNKLFYATSYRDYSDYQDINEKLLTSLASHGILGSKPRSQLISVRDISMKAESLGYSHFFNEGKDLDYPNKQR